MHYYAIIDFGIGCYLNLSTWINVIVTEQKARWIYIFKGWQTTQQPVPKSMIVLFHENVLLLSTYKFIVITIKYRDFGAFVYD
jgi:hypothetical protein